MTNIDSIVCHNGNQLAIKVTKMLCDNPKTSLYPLIVLYGQKGTGKTTLLEIIAKTMQEKNIPVSWEKNFASDVVIFNNTLTNEDYEFLRDCYNKRIRVIIALDCHPLLFPSFSEPLKSLLSRTALIVDLQLPSIFVYGTLKKGFCNHPLLKRSKFLDNAQTFKRYPMICTHLAYPYLIDKKGKGCHVKGEVYQVDYRTLAQLDELEGYPEHYVRKEIEIVFVKRKQVIIKKKQKYVKSLALVYFLAKKIDYSSYPMMEEFENNIFED